MNESKVLGKFARLYVSKITKFGVMLRSFEEKDLEVLLPNNQVKKGTQKAVRWISPTTATIFTRCFCTKIPRTA